uniref:Uncharacterized protein n=1 Tax=Octopus bimaculoides TaxID=37653 RepID=A0A0L8GX88_OCTBM
MSCVLNPWEFFLPGIVDNEVIGPPSLGNPIPYNQFSSIKKRKR